MNTAPNAKPSEAALIPRDAAEVQSLLRALRTQRQIDEDGNEVAVSRMAVDYAANYIEHLESRLSPPSAVAGEMVPICLLCGRTSPCMFEKDLGPEDPGVPCTFDPAGITRAYQNGIEQGKLQQAPALTWRPMSEADDETIALAKALGPGRFGGSRADIACRSDGTYTMIWRGFVTGSPATDFYIVPSPPRN